MKLLAVIVLFKPDEVQIRKEMDDLSSGVDRLLLWDNSPAESGTMPYSLMDDVDYFPCEENSISKGLNYAWRYAKEHGYDCLLTMDQDSVFEDFAGYKARAESMLEKEECIIGPWYFPPVSQNDADPVIEREHIITSGMIVPVSVLDRIGGYCEEFKIDGIDIDLCVRARREGIKVYQCVNERLAQQFGGTYEKTVFGHRFSGPGYGPERLYGIMRNYLIIYRKYGHPEFVKKQLHWFIANYIPNIIFAERNKARKLLGIIRGLWDGFRYRVTD